MTALAHQEGGSHYKSLKIQPIEYITANNLGFLEGNVVKYVTRHAFKSGAVDLRKAKHYIDLALELQYGEKPEQSSGEWIKWEGDFCPVSPETMVEVCNREMQCSVMAARSVEWKRVGRPADVAFYRVVKAEQKADDGWIEWNGGKQPVASIVAVKVRRRDGSVSTERANMLYWRHRDLGCDIVAYRVCTDA